MSISYGFLPSHKICTLLNHVKIASIQLLHVCWFQEGFIEGSCLEDKAKKMRKKQVYWLPDAFKHG